MKNYVGIDLHSNNSFFGVVNADGKRIFDRRTPNKPEAILKTAAQIAEYGEIVMIGVESTFNWYWLVDLLREHGYPVILGNPSAMTQYHGLKHSDDKSDSFFLAELLRLNIFPKCWTCPKEMRPVRELLRSRTTYVSKRTAYKLSINSLFYRHQGNNIASSAVMELSDQEILDLCEDELLAEKVRSMVTMIKMHDEEIARIESLVKKYLKESKAFKLIQTVPGIGPILAMTILLETGDIHRFKKVGNYASYCRCVSTDKVSNGKSKGKANKKNGNKYLAWAFVEAANRAYCEDKISRYFQRKKARRNHTVAVKATAAKLTKAVYHILKEEQPFDLEKAFH